MNDLPLTQVLFGYEEFAVVFLQNESIALVLVIQVQVDNQ
jgi:hypothetical protein